jgi:hypothetical protein
MWLEDSLPSDLQKSVQEALKLGPARILIYGYDTHLENSQSFQTIEDLAGQLRMSLRAIRQVSSSKRRIRSQRNLLTLLRQRCVCGR